MVVNVSKTKFIIFHTKGKNVDRNLKLYYDDNEPNNHDQNLIVEIDCIYTNHPEKQQRAYKLLGVYFDEYLTFDHHTQHLLSKINRSLYCINSVKKKSYY